MAYEGFQVAQGHGRVKSGQDQEAREVLDQVSAAASFKEEQEDETAQQRKPENFAKPPLFAPTQGDQAKQ